MRDNGLPSDRGSRDGLHHRERMRKVINEQLKKRIGEEDIIAAGPEKRIRVPIKGQKRYRFIYDRGEGGVGQGDYEEGDQLGPGNDPGPGASLEPGEEMYEVTLDMDAVEESLFAELGLPRLKPKNSNEMDSPDIRFDDRALKGPILDKKATLKENMIRNAKSGDLHLGGIEKEDLRFLTYRDLPRPKTQAVVFCMMDLSGSMGELEKRISRLFYYWVVRFLRTSFTQVDVVFLGHTTECFELSEHEFFARRESGGTLVSAAYKEALSIQRNRYPASDWNVYVLHTSDGDNWATDNEEVARLIAEHLKVASLVGYLEIPHSYSATTLGMGLADLDLDGFVMQQARSEKEIWPALKELFKREGVEDAVSA